MWGLESQIPSTESSSKSSSVLPRRVIVGRRIGKVAQTLEDKADTARYLPVAIVAWTLSFVLREVEHKLYGTNEG